MNKFTLNFKSSHFENLYRASQHKKELELYRTSFICFVIILSISIVNNFASGFFTKGALLLLLLLMIVGSYFASQKSYTFLDYSIFSTSLLVNIYIAYILYARLISVQDPKMFSQYFLGLFHAHLQFGIFIGTRFYLKAFTFLINYFFNILYVLTIDQNIFVSARLLYIFSVFLSFSYCYQNEKQRRQLFMVFHQNSQWQRGLDSELDIGVISCKFNDHYQQIEPIKTNQISVIEFGIENGIQQFRYFLRNMFIQKISHQKEINNIKYVFYQVFKSLQSQIHKKLNLDPEKCMKMFKLDLSENIYNQYFYFIGFFQKKFYKLTLFTMYEDETQMVVLIQRQNDYESQVLLQQRIEYQHQIINKLLNLSQSVSRITGYLKSQSNYINQQINNCLINSYLCYNQILNVQCYCLNTKFNKHVRRFKLRKMLDEFKIIQEPLLKERKCELAFSIDLAESMELNQCYWMLYQILFNLIKNSIQFSQQQSQIVVQVMQIIDSVTDTKLIRFNIIDQNQVISKSTLDSLPMINPISIEEYIKINKYKHLRLGLIVANYLVSVIGPIKRLKFSQEAIGNCITFMVFEDLNCLPQNKFQKQKRSQISQKQLKSNQEIEYRQ